MSETSTAERVERVLRELRDLRAYATHSEALTVYDRASALIRELDERAQVAAARAAPSAETPALAQPDAATHARNEPGIETPVDGEAASDISGFPPVAPPPATKRAKAKN